MGDTKRVLLIGWDAADWKIIHQLMDDGLMPTLQSMINQGTMGNMRTLTPVLSPMLWTSIATGKRPFKHGIYGFTEPTPSGKNIRPMTNLSRKTKAVWNILNQNELQSVIVGWWPSHPAEPINGVMISDYFHKAPKKPGDAWNLLPSCVHPPELLDEVAKLRVHPMEMAPEEILPFIPHGAEIDQTKDGRVSSIMKMLSECTTVHATATHLLETQPWDFAAIYYDAIDHFCHGFMKYHPPQKGNIDDEDFRMYKNVVTTAYAFHDMMLKRLLEFAGDDTTVMLISDHGFHPDHLRPTSIPSEPAGPALEHRDYGILLVNGPNIKNDHLVHSAGLLDVTPTILALYGLPIGQDMDGQALTDMFIDQPEIEFIPSWDQVDGEDGQHEKGKVIDASESKAVMDQLVALGYIDSPADDSELAVSHTNRELDYNLARSYMDAGMHGEAVPLLTNLYLNHPLEFRFGIQLANCLRSLGQYSNLKRLVNDLNQRWRVAAVEARSRLGEIAKLARERREHWRELKKIDDENKQKDPDAIPLAKETPRGKPKIFEDGEWQTIRRLRAIARGNPQTVDFLAATIAITENDFEGALEFLDRSKITESSNPGFHFHVGNVYIGLKRWKDAEEAFKRGLKLDEFHPNCLMGLCRLSVMTDDNKKALEFGSQAIGLKYHFPLAHYYYGWATANLGDHERAVESLKIAVEQNPNFAEAHQLLAEIYAKKLSKNDLAEEHSELGSNLEEENVQVVQSAEPIEFPVITSDDFRDQLPTISGEEFTSPDFDRCLAQTRISEETPSGSNGKPIIVVSGLPRSGTSMMMQMLAAGGLDIYSDNKRQADDNNPKGYYEAEIVKQINKNNKWIADCGGKVVKVVAPLIPFLPQAQKYQVIFMSREIDEIVDSQSKMLERLGNQGADLPNERLSELFTQQAEAALALLKVHKNSVLEIKYRDAIDDPVTTISKVTEFLGAELDGQAMAGVVDPSLYRQRTSNKA